MSANSTTPAKKGQNEGKIRRQSDSNRRITVLQTDAFPLGYAALSLEIILFNCFNVNIKTKNKNIHMQVVFY